MVAIVGNKTDKADERCVTREEAEAKSKQFGAIYQETSAKTGANVKELFKEIAAAIGNDKSPPPETKKGVGLISPLEIPKKERAGVGSCCAR